MFQLPTNRTSLSMERPLQNEVSPCLSPFLTTISMSSPGLRCRLTQRLHRDDQAGGMQQLPCSRRRPGLLQTTNSRGASPLWPVRAVARDTGASAPNARWRGSGSRHTRPGVSKRLPGPSRNVLRRLPRGRSAARPGFQWPQCGAPQERGPDSGAGGSAVGAATPLRCPTAAGPGGARQRGRKAAATPRHWRHWL